jgi:hypothetical protein
MKGSVRQLTICSRATGTFNLNRSDASTVAFSYDNIGQLKVADSSVAGEDRGYFYVVNGPLNAPVSIFDLKTGSATLTPARIQQIQSHIPGGANVPVFPVRP